MKKLNLLFFNVLLLSASIVHAAETEPNNTKATANTFALNGSNAGAINVSGDEDWFSVTTNADGKLDVTITVSNGKTLRCYIYDNDGTTVLSSGYSSVTTTVTKDGLAAGIYYIKLIAYTTGQLPAYTVSNTLTVPAQANDAEPNGSRNQAIVLPLNGNKKGHIGYYYDLKRDTADWYKITTNADGLLTVMLVPANGTTTRIYLYDNNGTTLLNSAYSSSSAVINEDGLAKGNYYVKVICYTNSQFAPYTISNSLVEPAQANDAEPNDNRTQAKVLLLNSNITGHVGYYYNVKRDTADWYKITTNANGLLRLILEPANGTTTRIYLYDNDGATLLNSSYSSTKATISEDGLANGIYYVKVICYTSSQFAPYTFSDSLFTYNYANDSEPNTNAKQAKTIAANGTTEGHVGFYYNNARDIADWYKINYTGSGNLDFTINQETLISGGTNTLRFQVYKDTLAAAIHSSYSSAASRVVNLTSLTQGYYWIKLYAYNTSDFSSYSFSNSFTQVNIASIKPTTYDTAQDCSSVNSITFASSKSAALYTVQLYRFGVAYGNPVITSKKATFTNLPTGSYYATVFGDGATGSAFGKSKNVSLEPVPVSLTTTNIQIKQAKLNWANISCAAYYTIQYKVHGTTNWIIKKTSGNVNNYVLKSLSANTTYDWRVAASDSANGIIATSAVTDSVLFTTATAGLIAQNETNEDDASMTNILQTATFNVSPNPATNFFIINLKNSKQEKVNAILFDMNGKAVWTSGLINKDALNGKRVMVNQFENGIYYLKITNEKNALLGVAKLMINK